MQVRDITEQDYEDIAAELRDLVYVGGPVETIQGLHLVHGPRQEGDHQRLYRGRPRVVLGDGGRTMLSFYYRSVVPKRPLA